MAKLSPQWQVEDLGTHNQDAVDYPDIANVLAAAMPVGDMGILICGSGIGISIAANRHANIRAALCHNVEYAKLAREHNNANVLALGARYLTEEEAYKIVITFLETPFLEGRHATRVAKL